MDIILVVVGIFLVIIGSVFSDSYIKNLFKIFGALLILIGGLLFVFTFSHGFNSAIQYFHR